MNRLVQLAAFFRSLVNSDKVRNFACDTTRDARCLAHGFAWHRSLLAVLLLLSGLTLISEQATAQQRQPVVGRGSYPSLSYYTAFHSLREGDLKLATEAFQETARSGMRTIDGAFVDAVCYRVMLGEAYLRQGRQQLAIDQYNAALNLMFKRQDWLKRVTFPPALQASNQRIKPPVTWGAGVRAAKYAAVPDKFQIMLGNLNNADVIQKGGVVVAREIHSINVHEIIRCCCLALRRRYELLGPVAEHDPLTLQMITAFDGRKGPPNHWTQSWLNVQRGWALTAAGKKAEAAQAFRASVLLGGKFDHPLTATALMGLGVLARDAGEPNEAMKFFIGASAAAAVYGDIEAVEDAMTAASDVHLAGVPATALPQLAPAYAWANVNRLPHLKATMTTLGAENLVALRKTAAAGKSLGRTKAAMGRRAMMSAQLAARTEFVTSQVLYQQGKVGAAEASFLSAIARQRSVSPWLNQISTVSKLYRGPSRALTGRSVSALFDQLLREPTSSDWSFRPLDTLAFVLTPNRPAHEDWFNLSLNRDESRKALEVGEILRRRRFYSQLPLGGRVLSLRWCLEAPEELLPEDALAARRDLLARYAGYKALSDKSRELRTALGELPIVVDEEQGEEQKKIAKELSEVSTLQEALLGEIALRRESCPFVFPPQMTSKELQESLKPKQLALVYVSTSREMHAFMLSRDDYVHWELPAKTQVRRDAMLLLKQWGMTSDAAQVTTELLRSTDWKQAGERLLRTVIDRGQHGFWNTFDELVIVPDGMMWYVPFEGLPIPPEEPDDAEPAPAGSTEDAVAKRPAKKPTRKEQEKAAEEMATWEPLFSRIRIRYVPTASLINTKRLPPSRDARTAVVTGKLFPRDDASIAKTQLEEIQAVSDSVVALPERLQADSGLLRCTWGGLVVFDDITDLSEGPLDWSPARVDGSRPGGKLRRWMALPWGGPSQIILPGFHSASETGLKKSTADGEEMFATSMALMATGARTIVLSRWRPGGLSSYDLVREFLQEEPDVEPSEAWQRSLRVLREGSVDPAFEPRVNAVRDKEPLSGDHPFFWSGFMLLGG